MVTRHDKVVRALYDLCKKHPSYSEAYADNVGVDYRPLDIVSPHAKGVKATVLSYHPDVWAVQKRNGKIDVLEVWDSQSESDSVEDMVLAALTPNVATLSIVCFGSDVAGIAQDIVSTILPSIRNSKGELLLYPSDVKPFIVQIPEGLPDSRLDGFLGEKLNLSLEAKRGSKSYVPGRSCGRGNHNWVRKGSYWKCTKCNATRMIS